MEYDLVVVGSGPAGLMTAKTAAEHNLEVVLVDAKREIPQLTRPCCMMLHMAPGLHNITFSVEPGKLVFHTNNFSVNYSGDRYNLYYGYLFSRSGYKYCTVNKNPCLGQVIDKTQLLRGLLDEVESLGVNVRTETSGLKAENRSDGVILHVRSRGQRGSIKAKIAVAADGCNSRITDSVGLNKTREHLGRTGPFVGYVMEGVECPYENAYLFYRASTYSPTIVVNTVPRACGNDVWMVLPRTKEGLRYFLTKGKVADWFKKAKIIQEGGYYNELYTPLKEPIIGNVLIVGDAAGTYEVEIHGALVCGYRAGVAVAKALTDKKGTGMEEYVTWWQNSIEYVKDPSLLEPFRKVATFQSFEQHFTEEEVDYLFQLIDHEMFPGVMDPFTGTLRMVDAFLKHHDILQKDSPSLLTKLEKWLGQSVAEFKASRSAFSYTLVP